MARQVTCPECGHQFYTSQGTNVCFRCGNTFETGVRRRGASGKRDFWAKAFVLYALIAVVLFATGHWFWAILFGMAAYGVVLMVTRLRL